MALLIKLFAFAMMITAALCTPDCYNSSATSVSKKWNGYSEPLPPGLSSFRADWFTLKPGHNCAFYTFNDIYFASFHPSIQGIYLNFLNATAPGQTKAQCTLESTKINNFASGSWLYANSTRAPQGMCGYYVGVANSDSREELAFQIIRYKTEGVTSEKLGSTSSAYSIIYSVATALLSFIVISTF
jgi:hypothetical protein